MADQKTELKSSKFDNMTRTIYTDNPKKSYDGKYFLKNEGAVPTNSVNGSKEFINLKG